MENELRLAIMVQSPWFEGFESQWYHRSCFLLTAKPQSVGDISHFELLRWEDQKRIREEISVANIKRKLPESVDVPAKKLKTEEDVKRDEMIEKQNMAMYKMRDEIVKAVEQKHISKRKLQKLLQYNDQELPRGASVYDFLADVMTFGALLPCEQCKTGQYVYRSGVGYQCMGRLAEFNTCDHITGNPDRVPFKIPEDLQLEAIPFLKNYEPKVEMMVIPEHEKPTVIASTSSAAAASDGDLLKVTQP